MAILQFFGVTPGTAMGQAQLTSNMVALRDAMRSAGRNANLTRLVSGGMVGAMGMSMEFPDWETWFSHWDAQLSRQKNEVPVRRLSSRPISERKTQKCNTSYPKLPEN